MTDVAEAAVVPNRTGGAVLAVPAARQMTTPAAKIFCFMASPYAEANDATSARIGRDQFNFRTGAHHSAV